MTAPTPTHEQMRAKLRELVEAWPHACKPSEVDALPDDWLEHRLRAHGVDPDTLEPGTDAQVLAWRQRYRLRIRALPGDPGEGRLVRSADAAPKAHLGPAAAEESAMPRLASPSQSSGDVQSDARQAVERNTEAMEADALARVPESLRPGFDAEAAKLGVRPGALARQIWEDVGLAVKQGRATPTIMHAHDPARAQGELWPAARGEDAIGAKVAHVKREASKGQGRPHHCHARGCEKQVPPAFFMCAMHWAMVPARLRQEIWRHYNAGQENGDAEVSSAYLEIADAAVRAVAEREAEAPNGAETPRAATRRTLATWMPRPGFVAAISVRQPWAWAIAWGGKDVENREWPALPAYRGDLLIHASGTCSPKEYAEAAVAMEAVFGLIVPPRERLALGAIVARARLLDVAPNDDPTKAGPWAVAGQLGLRLGARRPVRPRPWKGAPYLFEVPATVAAELEVGDGDRPGPAAHGAGIVGVSAAKARQALERAARATSKGGR